MKLITHRSPSASLREALRVGGRIILFALCATAFSPLRAEGPERTVPSSLVLDAQLTSNAAVPDDHLKGFGNEGRMVKARTMGGQVRNLGRTPAKAQLSVYWIGKVTGTSTRVVIAERTDPLTIAPGGAQKFSSASGEVKSNDMKLRVPGFHQLNGYKLEGWACVLRDDDSAPPHARGALLAVKASDTHLDELVRLRETLAALPRLKDGKMLKK
jgi:hypothetical protein